ncbi:MAG: adenine nucleotide alpha hydrolase [Xanthobacteraceae bacterium]|nr:adenine nucleotide alpha hydrolase [Xanthobacteraceae bacterium]
MSDVAVLRDGLRQAIEAHASLAVAVSGGVDSMTLAHFAHAATATRVVMVHAASPAVPAHATARVRDHAARFGWDLIVTDAGEFADPRYRTNPADRCYFCKSNLYDRIRQLTAAAIASGANLDDLDDYRPGLIAARERDVVHPFIEAGFAKSAVRALAHAMALEDLAELPAQPCLSSRIQTAIAVRESDLAFVDAVEQAAGESLPPSTTIRCRITREGVVLELGPIDAATKTVLERRVGDMCGQAAMRFAGIRDYVRGSAFVRTAP